MSGGYNYGESEPVETCGACGGEVHAEYCDVGITYVQIAPFHCTGCGATLEHVDDEEVWKAPPNASERNKEVTGFLVTPGGSVIETTFDEDHAFLYRRLHTNLSKLLHEGGVRITRLEGYTIDLPTRISPPVKRALSKPLRRIDQEGWGLPYAMSAGDLSGKEMTIPEIMARVSRLPPPERQPNEEIRTEPRGPRL